MQKKLTFLALALVVITSFACRKQVTEVTEVTEVINPAKGIRFEIKPSDWVTEDEYMSLSAKLPVPELDDTIYDHGAVVTYLSLGTNYFEALPEVFEGLAYGAIHSAGWVTIDYHALDGGTVQPPSQNVQVKIVLIPATAMKAHPDVNLRNFREVERVFLKP